MIRGGGWGSQVSSARTVLGTNFRCLQLRPNAWQTAKQYAAWGSGSRLEPHVQSWTVQAVIVQGAQLQATLRKGMHTS